MYAHGTEKASLRAKNSYSRRILGLTEDHPKALAALVGQLGPEEAEYKANHKVMCFLEEQAAAKQAKKKSQ